MYNIIIRQWASAQFHALLLTAQRLGLAAIAEQSQQMGKKQLSCVHPQHVALTLFLFSGLTLYGAFRLALLDKALLPLQKNNPQWHTTVTTDRQRGGNSSISVRDAKENIDFDFTLDDQERFPYASFAVLFGEPMEEKLADWSQYRSITMDVRCQPANVFTLMLHVVDPKVTRAGDFSSFRPIKAYFNCDPTTRRIEIDLRHLEVPEWWLHEVDLELSDDGYNLGKLLDFAFISSLQSPRGITSNMLVTEIHLRGTDWRYLYVAGGLVLVLWSGFAMWYWRRPSQASIEASQPTPQQEGEPPPMAYQQVPAQVRQDKDRDAVLRYMATHYNHSELSLEMAAAHLGINRTKINKILKGELGFTFNVYLTKLRLTEAARLLLEKDASVAEIAYRVGYSNPSYFITVFKKEYGCTPKNYKNQRVTDSETV